MPQKSNLTTISNHSEAISRELNLADFDQKGIVTNQLTTGADNWGGELIDYLPLIIGIALKAL